MRRTKIVATVGPKSRDPEVLREMVRAGMDVVRINLSHGDVEDHRAVVRAVRALEAECGRPLGILFDTAGPEVRLTGLPDVGLELAAGDVVRIGSEPPALKPSWPEVVQHVAPGATLLLDDGNIVLKVREAGDPLVAEVVAGGRLVNGKKLSCPGARWPLEVLTDADRAALAMGVAEGIDWVAASFVRSADDVFAVKRALEELGAWIPVMAKIESALAVEALDEIVTVADGVMVARGDLGVELPVEQVPWLQKQIIEQAHLAGKPVVTATQMLESMVEHPRPTRAEVTDVANAIWDGTDAVMLSAETAVGRWPALTVATMARIAEAADRQRPRPVRGTRRLANVTQAVSHASVTAAEDLGASAIITATESGHTAEAVAHLRPTVPILAVTARPQVARRLAVVWGVTARLMEPAQNTDDMMDKAVRVALASGLVHPGDLVVLTGGVPVGQPGSTNLLRVLTIGEAILRGQGIGRDAVAVGEVIVVTDVRAVIPRQVAGKILVARATTRDWVPLIEVAAGLIVEQGGLTSHAAVVGLSLGKPTVVGARDATTRLTTGQTVTVDGQRGLVYAGTVQI
ncbi:MAG: pyruvate kinase [Actinomycetia bacterium]|nr:pyruvate kinase [Actinomycetes bacterium]